MASKPPVKQGLSLGVILWISLQGLEEVPFIHRVPMGCA